VYIPTRSLLTSCLVLISFLLIPLGVRAQDSDHGNASALLARLSYQNSAVVQAGGVRNVCVAVSQDGDYRMVRSGDYGQTVRLRGKMPKEQLQQLTQLLGAAEFRTLSGDHSGLIRQDAEVFAAEISGPMREHVDGARQWMDRDVRRLQWLNADGESPFPVSVAKVVDWLQHFQPKDGKSFLYAEFPDVCPAGGLRLVQPAVAANDHR